jgi:hypothetical protein
MPVAERRLREVAQKTNPARPPNQDAMRRSCDARLTLKPLTSFKSVTMMNTPHRSPDESPLAADAGSRMRVALLWLEFHGIPKSIFAELLIPARKSLTFPCHPNTQ